MALTNISATSIVRIAGTSLRIRRIQKSLRSMDPVLSNSVSRIRVIRKPDITKNTVTPISPPLAKGKWRWYARTARTAIALSPSIPYMYFCCPFLICFLLNFS